MRPSWKSAKNNVEDLFRRGKWKSARRQIERELRLAPNDHWLLTRLGTTYYEDGEYKRALRISQRAVRLAPKCPLVLWDYACSLDMVSRHQEAIALWKRLLRRGVKAVAYGEHGEGIRWSRSLLNDCRYRIALSYRKQGMLNISLRYLRRHIAERGQGTPSIYGLADAKRELARLLTERRPK